MVWTGPNSFLWPGQNIGHMDHTISGERPGRKTELSMLLHDHPPVAREYLDKARPSGLDRTFPTTF